MPKFGAFVLVVFCLLPAIASASNWKVIGGNTTAKEDTISLYDAESVVVTTPGSVRVWTKTVPAKSVKRYMSDAHSKTAEGKALIDATAAKIVTGYVPPWIQVLDAKHKLAEKEDRHNAIIEITEQEVVINKFDPPVSNKLLFEVDCKGQRMRVLSASVMRLDGSISSSSSERPFDYISPDSTGEYLAAAVCPRP